MSDSKLKKGMKFLAYDDSHGNSAMFWVDTLTFRMEGSFHKGDILELKDVKMSEDKKITLVVEVVDKELDLPVNNILLPVSMVGIDPDVKLQDHKNMLTHLTDVKNNNRVFLLVLLVQAGKKSKVRVPLEGTGNVMEFTIDR